MYRWWLGTLVESRVPLEDRGLERVMRISTRGRYALRAMVDLAQHGDQGPVPRQEIAERQEISADYLAQLFVQLQAAGLVEGVKGPGGGYRLGRAPSLICAEHVVRAVEGPVAVVHCALPCPQEGPTCQRVDQCVTHRLWKRVSQAVVEVLGSVTLKDLADQARALTS
jgi:Rrf2 family iron-sulfur cluster assembly transcriptional regulator